MSGNVSPWPSQPTHGRLHTQVGDIADVFVDEEHAGIPAWAPYCLQMGKLCQDGSHQLEIQVTSSMDNYCNGAQAPSGLMGPIHLRRPA